MAGPAPTGSQAAATEAYRENPYPPMVHVRNHPDRYATIARLLGMDPPAIDTARVLEIGVGNGLNLLSLAQAYPRAQFVGFDIEAAAIADGDALRAEAGLTNARLEVLDLLHTDGRIEGQFDYIIAHGVFAWVPPPVAEALLALIGRHLSPQGVAMVSFNALPGCYLRQGLRDMLLRAAAGATTADERLRRARAAMEAVVDVQTGDGVEQRGFRETVRLALEGTPRVLLHDEMGADWHPRRLADVLTQVAPHGLAFLGDSTIGRFEEALAEGIDDARPLQDAIEQRAVVNDERMFCSFHRLLLVRAAALPTRVLRREVVATLFASCTAIEDEPGLFVKGPARFKIEHADLAAAVRRLIAAAPARVLIADLGLAPALIAPLIKLFDCDFINLHTTPAPYATTAPARPRTSPLARAMIARGLTTVATLAHRPIELEGSVAQGVAALDGGPDAARFDAVIAAAGLSRGAALANLAALGVLMPD